MRQSTIPAATVEPDDDAWDLHPTITDDDIAAEAEYRAEEQRRHAADPSEADLQWWSEQGRDDDEQKPDDLLDARADDALGQDRLEAGCLM